MATQLQIRRGTNTQNGAFTGAEGELSANTTNDSVHVHDGSTAGGFELARADFGNISTSATLTIATLNTTNLDLTNLEVTNLKAKDGTAAGSIADSTGVVTIASAVLTTADINGGTADSLVIGASTPAAGSFTTGSFSGDVSFADNAKAIFGAGSDLQIYHDASHSYIVDAGTGNMYLSTNGNGIVMQASLSETMFAALPNGAVTLYHDNAAKLATESGGVSITGTATMDRLGLGVAAHASAALNITTTNQHIRFNNGSELAIIDLDSDGELNIWAHGDGEVINLKTGSGSPTTIVKVDNTGIDVTGSVTADGLDVLSTTSGTSRTIRVASTASSGDNDATMIISNGGSGDAMLRFDYEGSNTDRARIGVSSSAQQLEFYTAGNNQRMLIDSSGNLALMTDGAEFQLYYTQPRKFISNSGASVTIKQIDNDATNAYIDFAAWDNSSLMRIMNSGSVGIGESSPLGKLHVKTADSGATVDVSANELVVEGNGNTGITILSGQSYSGSIYFGDAGVNYDGYISYSQAARKFVFGAAAGANTVEIDSTSVLLNGIVTKPEQPAFSARTDSGNHDISAGSNVTISYNVEIFDQNADYNTSTYQFTAPVTGKYQLQAHLRVNNLDIAANYYLFYIHTSNRDYYHIIDPDCFDSDPAYYAFELAVLADMDANDVAYISIRQDGGTTSAQFDGGIGSNNFSGYLVA